MTSLYLMTISGIEPVTLLVVLRNTRTNFLHNIGYLNCTKSYIVQDENADKFVKLSKRDGFRGA